MLVGQYLGDTTKYMSKSAHAALSTLIGEFLDIFVTTQLRYQAGFDGVY